MINEEEFKVIRHNLYCEIGAMQSLLAPVFLKTMPTVKKTDEKNRKVDAKIVGGWTDGFSITIDNSVSYKAAQFVFAHELMHNVFGHIEALRAMPINDPNKKYILNVAQDYVINNFIATNVFKNREETSDDFINNTMQNNNAFIEGFIPRNEALSKSSEEIYRIIMRKMGENPKISFSPNGEGGGTLSVSANGKKFELPISFDPQKLEESENKMSENDKIKPSPSAAQDIINETTKNCGTGTEAMNAELELLKNPVDLVRDLTHALKLYTGTGTEASSFTRLSKVNLAMPDLPFRYPVKKGVKFGVSIGVDTSGSISDEELSKFNSIIYANMNKLFGKMYLFTDQVNDMIPIDSLTEDDLVKRRFSGGTDLRDLFKLAQQDGYRMLICFTDLFVDIPAQPKGVDVLWVIPLDQKKPPYGRVIRY